MYETNSADLLGKTHHTKNDINIYLAFCALAIAPFFLSGTPTNLLDPWGVGLHYSYGFPIEFFSTQAGHPIIFIRLLTDVFICLSLAYLLCSERSPRKDFSSQWSVAIRKALITTLLILTLIPLFLWATQWIFQWSFTGGGHFGRLGFTTALCVITLIFHKAGIHSQKKQTANIGLAKLHNIANPEIQQDRKGIYLERTVALLLLIVFISLLASDLL